MPPPTYVVHTRRDSMTGHCTSSSVYIPSYISFPDGYPPTAGSMRSKGPSVVPAGRSVSSGNVRDVHRIRPDGSPLPSCGKSSVRG